MSRDLNTGTDVIGYDQCLELLSTEEVGRLAVVIDGRPEVFPVNYILDGDSILFRTESGTKLTAAILTPVAFEVDHLDHATRSGWSVVVHGRAARCPVSGSCSQQPVSRVWLDVDRPHLVRVTPTAITGRRIAGRPGPIARDLEALRP